MIQNAMALVLALAAAPGGGPLIIEVPATSPSDPPESARAESPGPAAQESPPDLGAHEEPGPATGASALVAESGAGGEAAAVAPAEAHPTLIKETRDPAGGKVQVIRDASGTLIELVSDADGYLVSVRALGPEKSASPAAVQPGGAAPAEAQSPPQRP